MWKKLTDRTISPNVKKQLVEMYEKTPAEEIRVIISQHFYWVKKNELGEVELYRSVKTRLDG